MKPYVICHSLSSVDGRIQSTRWAVPKMAKVFENTAKKIKVDAWIVGRTTMEEFSSKKAHRLGKPDRSLEKRDFVGRHEASTYAVGIDPAGKTRWDKNMVDTDHVIVVLTEQVSTAVLRHYQQKQVSYLFAGEKELHLETALRKLHQLFGISKCRVDGGGTVNGSFLKAGLIDELSHIVVPVADGAMGVPTSFDVDHGHTSRLAKKLSLKTVKKLPGGVLWVRYRVKN